MKALGRLLLVLAVMTAGSAFADDAALQGCLSGGFEQRIAACARIIDATQKPPAETLVRAYVGRCEAHRQTRDFDKSILDCSEAIRLDPKSDLAFSGRGYSRRAKNDIDGALSDLATAVYLGSGDRVADYHIARVYLLQMKSDWKGCLNEVEAALRIRPGEKAFISSRGWCFAQMGDWTSARRDYDAVIAADPNFVGGYVNRGRGLLVRNDPTGALADFEMAVKLSPRTGLNYFYRALARERRGELAEAAADLEAALQRSPGDRNARAAQERVQAALKARSSGSAQSASPPPAPPATAAAASGAEAAVDLFALRPQEATARRVALVIGNSAYKFASPLPNPANDSADIGNALKKLGFTVIEGRDLDWRGMVATIREFVGKLDKADLALFFYAGHGIQVNGENYLIPVDAKLETPGNLDLDAVDMRTVLRPMEARNRVNLVFLDACRDNPFTRSLARNVGAGTRSVSASQGLAQIQSAAGTMIAYATQPDNVARDGDGRNSPFTAALLKYLPKPGLEVEQMMKLVRVDVMNATQQRQVPWGHSSLVGDVFLAR